MLTAIVVGLAGSYLLRAALVHVGGVNLESPSALRHLAELGLDWRFWAGGTLIVIIL